MNCRSPITPSIASRSRPAACVQSASSRHATCPFRTSFRDSSTWLRGHPDSALVEASRDSRRPRGRGASEMLRQDGRVSCGELCFCRNSHSRKRFVRASSNPVDLLRRQRPDARFEIGIERIVRPSGLSSSEPICASSLFGAIAMEHVRSRRWSGHTPGRWRVSETLKRLPLDRRIRLIGTRVGSLDCATTDNPAAIAAASDLPFDR